MTTDDRSNAANRGGGRASPPPAPTAPPTPLPGDAPSSAPVPPAQTSTAVKPPPLPTDLTVAMTDTNATATANAYLRTKVLGAKPEELRLMLIEGSIKFAYMARKGLETKNYELSYSGFSQCRDIVLELMTSAKSDEAPELAEQIRALYAFLYQQLVDCSFERDTQKLDKVIELLEFERETWQLACEKLRKERLTNPALGGTPTAAPTPAPTPGATTSPAANPLVAGKIGPQQGSPAQAGPAARAPLSIQA